MKFIKQATKDSRSKGKKIDCLETLRLEKNQWWFPVGSVCLSLFFALHIIAWALKSPVTWKEQWAKREKLPEKNIYFCFTDYTKSFDCVDHKKLWKILKVMGLHKSWLWYCTIALQNITIGIKWVHLFTFLESAC